MNVDEKKQLVGLLEDIQLKISSSTIMNGGFERMMDKIIKIESTQDKIIADANQLKEVIYEPTQGVFSRIKDCESNHNEKIYKLELENHHIKNNLIKLKDLDSNLNEVSKIKDNYSKFTWLVIAAFLSNIFWVMKNFVH